ncbi:hypothetical protein GIB67_003319 [Kingdonia uniflora]|uniref:Subtilisin-like protease n=1 Tax=Kingdonia uniflora TaxID=39325 RepID=A0A7J7P8N9_9MAGN|nr:hypothetical protein GIB67_003319 [Kingdonia uniflora]
MGPIPTKWKGFCQNNTKEGVTCNRKLIGARYFNKGYSSMLTDLHNQSTPSSSPRDTEGHGTHTLSTAAGRFISSANAYGFGNGTAKGGSPGARVAAYKVCWPPVDDGVGCCDADILAAFDAAIHDGVNILSVSISGSTSDYWSDATAIGAFHAVKNGIVVVCSGGNDGPEEGTVSNVAPWIITVGANTIDREFPSYVELGNKKRLKGQSLSPKGLPAKKLYPLAWAGDIKAAHASQGDALSCIDGTLDPKKAKGKIIACLDGDIPRVEKGKSVADAGGVGMIIANDNTYGNEVAADAHVLPTSHIPASDAPTLFSYINSTKSPKAYITRAITQLDTKPAPVMASFSSRGPNPVSPEILKPDITAPGVNILAAYSQAALPTDMASDKRRVLFNFVSGTSMSSPHVAGIAGLLKTLHPEWSPSVIKSAIMTTARTRDNMNKRMRDWTAEDATPFGYGAGHIRLLHAMDPGLVYDLAMHDYLNFLCAHEYNQTMFRVFIKKPYLCPESFNILDFNYPSITVPDLVGSVSILRTVKNIGPPGTYTARIQEPIGVFVSVEPKILKFERTGEKKNFRITLEARKAEASTHFVFGRLIWSDGVHRVRSPIVVRVGEAKTYDSGGMGGLQPSPPKNAASVVRDGRATTTLASLKYWLKPSRKPVKTTRK